MIILLPIVYRVSKSHRLPPISFPVNHPSGNSVQNGQSAALCPKNRDRWTQSVGAGRLRRITRRHKHPVYPSLTQNCLGPLSVIPERRSHATPFQPIDPRRKCHPDFLCCASTLRCIVCRVMRRALILQKAADFYEASYSRRYSNPNRFIRPDRQERSFPF